MRPKVVITLLGALASIALVLGLSETRLAQADRENGVRAGNAVVKGGEVRAGNAVVDKDGARIEGGSSADGAEAPPAEKKEGQSAPAGEAVLRMKGDEGVEFSGTCSVGGETQEIEGQVPEEFTFVLDGDELECEFETQGDGMLKMVLVHGNDRIVQKVSGGSTTEFSYSGNGVSSSTSSSTSVSGSGSSSSVVNQSSSAAAGSSSSSVVQSSSSTR